jgi:hypothetical protein
LQPKKFSLISLPSKKPYFGKPELKLLIEHEHLNAHNIDNSQQHILAWLLGWCCGVRSSSLGRVKGREETLRWESVRITCDPSRYGFKMKITFPFFKGHFDEDLELYYTGTDNPSEYACPQCNRQFSRKTRLDNHRRDVHQSLVTATTKSGSKLFVLN